MNLAGVHAQNQVSQVKNVKVLQDGQSVAVRVIASKGGGRYEGFVAGVRVNLRSENPLKPGDTFTAVVSLKSGIIEVIPKSGSSSFQNTKIFFEAAGQPENENLLTAMGLSPDELNRHIAMQMKQLGMRLDGDLLRKIRALSVKLGGGREKKLSQLITLLKAKGIELGDSALLSFFDLLENDSYSEEKQKTLKVVNHKNGWIFLPYEIVKSGGDEKGEEVLGTGIIRLLIDEAKSLKKLNFNVAINHSEYRFVLDFEKKRIKNLMVNVSPDPADKEDFINALQKKLIPFGNVKICWESAESLDGTACETEKFYSVGGVV